MKALVLTQKNELPHYIDVHTPEPTANEALVHISAAAMNHRDLWITKGMYAGIDPPVILGSEASGTYKGEEVIINPSLNWGDNERFQSKEFTIVGLPTDGTFAEYIKIPQDRIYPKPKHMTTAEAAAFPLAAVTAWRALVTKANIQKGDNVLISGIGGGVAIMACQLAVLMGAHVFVTSSKQDKIDFAIGLGAKGGVNYKDEDWSKQLKTLTGGFDIIIDSAAGPSFHQYLFISNPGARIVIYGGTRGNIDNLNPQILFWKQISLMGTSMGSDKDFEEVLAFINKHKLKPIVYKTYNMKDYKEAFAAMEAGKQLGKIVLIP